MEGRIFARSPIPAALPRLGLALNFGIFGHEDAVFRRLLIKRVGEQVTDQNPDNGQSRLYPYPANARGRGAKASSRPLKRSTTISTKAIIADAGQIVISALGSEFRLVYNMRRFVCLERMANATG
jgi:hypothetical protein